MTGNSSQATPRTELLERAKSASTGPGVYLMKDPQGAILYVGKAKSLKNRLTSYFQPAVHPIPRIDLLVARIERFDVILTETEAEALILECTLIKKHKPKFNVRLKDDKAYPYLKIQLSEPYPRIEWTRRVKKDGARYFGPFPSAWSARQVLRLLNETFALRDCSDNTFRHRSRACILYQMGKCTAPCVQKISREDYAASISEAIAVLEGKGDRVARELRGAMDEAASREEYELAAEFRDQLQNLELVTATQVAHEAGSDRDCDVVAIARPVSTEGAASLGSGAAAAAGGEVHGVLLQIRGGRMLAVRHYHLQNSDASLGDAELLFDFLAQYYLAADQAAEAEVQSTGVGSEPPAEIQKDFGPSGPAMARPREVLLAHAPEDPELLERVLGVEVRTAESEAERQLTQVALANARYALEQAAKKSGGHGVAALEEVMEKLQLSRLPQRIECYDISNTQGEEAVASRVVFIDGAPDKNLYRRYKIQTVVGSNDFAMMREVLGRRFSRTEDDFPDLVVVDGGKGQLSQASAIFEELGVQGVGLVGLAKARTERDFRAVEVKSSMERVFIPGRKNPVPLLPHTAAYKLLTHVRDEAHRFAISYHRLLRGKRSLKSGEGSFGEDPGGSP